MKVLVPWIAAFLIWRPIREIKLMPAELHITPINGVFELVSQPFVDARGAFLNAFRAQDEAFIRSWGDRGIAQVNLSRNEVVGTIRGLHLQAEPHSEAKLVRCLKGRVWDLALDLRRHSDTYGQCQAVELSPERGNALLIPEGCAHGFQVLEPGSELLYLHSGTWVPEAETGVRWNDPHLAIVWPLPPTELSERDRSLPFVSESLFIPDAPCP
jgi:dTDP-4-dehydrorhamnose 3,5-epimerase